MRIDSRAFLPEEFWDLPEVSFSLPYPNVEWMYRPIVHEIFAARHFALLSQVDALREKMREICRLMLQVLLLRSICQECAGHGMIGGKVEVVLGKDGKPRETQVPARKCRGCLGTGERSELTQGVADAGSVLKST